ncbi:acyl-CoA dehydrogenase family member 11-like isoform X2 [Anneissia japonica]|uniref:acyl-CoA dehydrogenase family member 11-like isoform X1 n=1 Tax=Anneissia japonica TaxID=1529436 RepID=UPI0014257024|nr:acyl-CoA dehydrogenase family member 11-like isoform X1 [Anneissia japonica]XP_033109421.1 acyl-CoA dehydrogenase family member 11-like isoform X2 [Anneissia japonica]
MFCRQAALCVNRHVTRSSTRCLVLGSNTFHKTKKYDECKTTSSLLRSRARPGGGGSSSSSISLFPGSSSKAFSSTGSARCTDQAAGLGLHPILPGPSDIPYSRAKLGAFSQVKPKLTNAFTEDNLLQTFLRRTVPKEVLDRIYSDLERFGERIASEIDGLGEECEKNPPKHKAFDAWGNRVDELNTCVAWKKQHDISAKEGLVAIPYEKEYGTWSRLYQLSKLYMYAPSSGLYSCPLAMTDGAASFFRLHPDLPMKERAFSRLISRNPKDFWTSGQWMTEKRGGSDVGLGTETIAIPQPDGTYKLHGYKWFSSATDADMTLTLARIVDEHGQTNPGSRGLSLFYLETKTADGKLNNIEIQKLKDKLGTRQLPTAELLLDGTIAHLVSEEGRGVSSITSMLTISRIHTIMMAVSNMRRIVHLARDYCLKRTAFGKVIMKHPLHMQTLSRLEVEVRAAFLLVMEIGRLLGLEDCGEANQTETNLLRLLTPLAKLYTGKQAISVASESLECFGGQGYIEDSGLPVFLRDAQVLSIWEGTTNILSLDVLRAITKSNGQVLLSFFEDIECKLKNITLSQNNDLKNSALNVTKSLKDIKNFVEMSYHQSSSYMEAAARDFAFSLARIYMATLILDHAAWEGANSSDVLVAKRWCEKDLAPVVKNAARGHYSAEAYNLDCLTVLDGHPEA